MLVVVLFICLALNATTTIEAAAASRLSDDSSEQSGDFDTGINQFRAETPDLSERSNEDEITKTFSNQQQRQRKQQKQIATNAAGQRPQTKAKQRKADLNDDVNDFIELVPKAEIKAKIEEYYRNDMDVQHIFEYMHGKEFLELRKNILELPDVKETLQYLNKNGLNAKSLVRKLDHRLGVSKIRSSQLAFNPQTQFGELRTVYDLYNIRIFQLMHVLIPKTNFEFIQVDIVYSCSMNQISGLRFIDFDKKLEIFIRFFFFFIRHEYDNWWTKWFG